MCFVFCRNEIQLLNPFVDGKLTVLTSLLFYGFFEVITQVHPSLHILVSKYCQFLYWVPFLGRSRRKGRSPPEVMFMYAVRQLLPGI